MYVFNKKTVDNLFIIASEHHKSDFWPIFQYVKVKAVYDTQIELSVCAVEGIRAAKQGEISQIMAL